MKNTTKIIAAIVVSMILTNVMYSLNKNSNPDNFIINGIILKTSELFDKKCKIELFLENNVIEEKEVNLNKPFEFKLQKNSWYTIRVTKEGFVPLLISFNTEIKNSDQVRNNVFEFETELIELSQTKFMDKEYLDFPVGLVAYNPQTKMFEARESYTVNYVTSIYRKNVNNADIAKENIRKVKIGTDLC